LEQKAALDASNSPSRNNPLATRKDLPAAELTLDQKDALDAAKSPSRANPLATLKDLPANELTYSQKAALDAANNPSRANPLATRIDLPLPELTPDQKAALERAHSPNADNPFCTRSELPPGLPPDQKDALDHAHQPSANNPVATLADLSQAGVVSRVVAAGLLDLSNRIPSPTLGDLRVVDLDTAQGLATLSFAAYQSALKDRYIVSALPVNVQARAKPADLYVVNLLGFDDQGFTLQMGRMPSEASALGPCMVQVSQMLSEIAQPSSSIEQAIKLYYRLIQQMDYESAWPMLSDAFRRSLGLLSYEIYKQEWNKSGPAILLALEASEVAVNNATFVLDLNYPREREEVVHKIRYEFIRDNTLGHQRFDYWLFQAGKIL
jgi:hypothetical protein